MKANKISSEDYYEEFHGHREDDLLALERGLRGGTGRRQGRRCLYLAGDSSLDNKYWFEDQAKAINGYEKYLSPQKMRRDVCYWLNKGLVDRGLSETHFSLNCAVEESMIQSRSKHLLPQDLIVRDTIQEEDTLIISLGGNDIALGPSLGTILNMLSLLYCTTTDCLDAATCGCSLPCDDSCHGWGPGCFSNFLSFPWGYGYFVHLFGTRIQHVIEKLTANKRPGVIAVCMIYYPDETPDNSWANYSLAKLGYNRNPKKLQVLIDKLFRDATRRIRIQGSKVVAVPLSAVMDGKTHEDYCDRVEPSVQGGHKMAELILDHILPS